MKISQRQTLILHEQCRPNFWMQQDACAGRWFEWVLGEILAGFGFCRVLICGFEFARGFDFARGFVLAHAVELRPSLRGGGPDRTGRLFAALIRIVRSMEFSPPGMFPCPRSLRRDSEELSGAYAPPPRSGDIVACVSASGKAANKNSSPFVPAPALPASGYCSCHKLKSRLSQGSERMLPGTRSDSENMMPESTQFSSWSAAFPPRPCGTTRPAKRKRRPAVIPNFAFRQTEAGLTPLG